MMTYHIYHVEVNEVYPYYVRKVNKVGSTYQDVNEIICWLTGYSQDMLESNLKNGTTFEMFFKQAPHLNPQRKKIKGIFCGERIEEMEPSLMKEIRYLDKMIDERSRGRSMKQIFRED